MASIYQSIEILSKEKGIDLEVLTDAVKDAMVVAARKHYRTEADLVAEFNDKGAIEIYEVRQVVELVEDTDKEMTVGEAMRHDASAAVGSEIRFLRKTDSLGRISAQTAKQVILQKVREAERETVFAEFVDRVGGTDRAAHNRARCLAPSRFTAKAASRSDSAPSTFVYAAQLIIQSQGASSSSEFVLKGQQRNWWATQKPPSPR